MEKGYCLMKIGTATVIATGEQTDVVTTLEDVKPNQTVILRNYNGLDYVVSQLPSEFWQVEIHDV